MVGGAGYLEESNCPRCGFPGVWRDKEGTSFIHKNRDLATRCNPLRGKTKEEAAQDA